MARLQRSVLARWRLLLGGLGALMAVALAFTLHLPASQAQTPPGAAALPVLPSVQILKGTLISPTTAASVYGAATTSTDGLCQAFSTNAGVCVSGSRPRAPELKELARALRYDPDLIYEYVRNGVDTEFQYGLQKGALGVIIDGSGTAFDQAQLMVELLREAQAVNGTPYNPRYKSGTIQLTAAQFTAWTGISDSQAACDFIATGGIPAVFSGGCASGTALSGNITLSHVWVEADIGGSAYIFDPAYKSYEHKTGISGGVRSAMGFASGEAFTAATTGATINSYGTPSASGLNPGALNTKLMSWSATLQARLAQADVAGYDMADLIGGRVIDPATRPVGGWKQTAFAYAASASATWTGNIPDQYRTQLKLKADLSPGYPLWAQVRFFVDEIYGRRLELSSERISNPNPLHHTNMQGAQPWLYRPTLVLDGVTLITASFQAEPGNMRYALTLTADHPFAAASGSYGDAVVIKRVDSMYPAAIVNGWGDTSRGLAGKWEREQGQDRVLPITIFGGPPAEGGGPQPTPAGDLVRSRMGANWLAEFSRMSNLQGELANSRTVHLHTLGVVSAIANYVYPAEITNLGQDQEFSPQTGFSMADETTVIDLETSFGLVSRISNVLDRRAAVLAIAASAASLEGTMAEELTDSPDASSTARRFAWGNNPESGESPNTSARTAYDFNGTTAASASGMVVFENGYTGAWNGQEAIDSDIAYGFRQRLSQTVDAYAQQGFDVVAMNEALLGPGHRHGTESLRAIYQTGEGPQTIVKDYKRFATTQAGGALIATKYDGSGDPTQIAHVLTRLGDTFKGGGGSSITQAAQYDPKTAADVMKDRFVDRSAALGVNLSNGSAGFNSPVLKSTGQGDFPYKLERKLEIRGGTVRSFVSTINDNPFVDLDGVVSNWEGSAEISSSPMEAMGATRIQAAVPTLVAFVAMQDIWRNAPSAQREVAGELAVDWWGRKLLSNVVTILQGGSSQQYLKQSDGTYIPAGGGAGRVEVSGSRTAVRPQLMDVDHDSHQREAVNRVWRYSALTIKAFGPQGDERDYDYWEWFNGAPNTEAKWTGFRLSSWKFPQGVTLTLTYGARLAIPTAVTSNLGQTLSLPDIGESPCLMQNVDIYNPPTINPNIPALSATDAAGGITRVEFRAPQLRSLTQRGDERCPVQRVFTPDNQGQAAIDYTYDTLGRVKEARDAVAVAGQRGPHQFFIAEGYRGERQDPQVPTNGRYAVEWLKGGRFTRTTDELGRLVTSVMDGRGRVVSRTFPEGDQELFEYDALDNPLKLTQCPKTGCNPTDNRVVQATWDPVWNKPATITDPLGRVTSFTYWDLGLGGAFGNGAGQIKYAVRPAPNGEPAQPTYSFEYDSHGLLTRSVDPDWVETVNTYDASGYLASTRTGPTGLGLYRYFTPDTDGNVLETWDARGAATTKVTTAYDAMRRPTQVTAPLGAVTKTTYDAAGRPTKVEKRLWDGVTETWQTWRTGYTLTGQTWFTQDPSGDVALFEYDALDRKVKATAPTGDITAWTYDLASQMLKEQRAVGISCSGSPPACQEDYETFTYTANGKQASMADSRGSTTLFTYDGFDRPLRTTYPDGSWEENQNYDKAGNIGRMRTREGTYVAWTWDNLDRKKTQKGLWTDGATSGVSHEWWRMHDASFVYSYAGRMKQADTDQLYQSWTYDDAGRPASHTAGGSTFTYGFDVASNMTSLVYPGNLTETMTYDGLNRLTGVSTTGAAVASATLAYDTLSRRTLLTFGDGSTQAYAYEPDDDLSSIAHVFPNRTTDNVSYSWTYDQAGREKSETISNANYIYAPAASTQAYGAANGLNQYPTVAGQALTYRADGALINDGLRTYDYDEKRNLTRTVLVSNTGDFDYDYFDALGQRYFHYRNAPAATDDSRKELTDGLRPEVSWEEIYSTPEGGSTTTKGKRYYVLGPAADERLIYIDATVATPVVRYPHTSKLGSVIAVGKAGQAEAKYKYGAFGVTTDAPGTIYPWRYTGQRLNEWTGLYHYKARAYSPNLGRFLQPDPIGYKDGANLYQYVGDDPIDRGDPSGRYQRGTGFTNGEWDKFNASQMKEAKTMEGKADKLEARADKLDAKKQGSGDRLREAAGNLRAGAAKLRATGPDAPIANLLTEAEYDKYKRPGGSQAFTDGQVTRFKRGELGIFGDKGRLSREWIVGHESLHAAGLADQKSPKTGALAYRGGEEENDWALRDISRTDLAAKNPDSLLSDDN